MFDKLEETEARFDEVTARLYEPDVVSDQQKYTALMKEVKSLTPLVEKYREYKAAKTAIQEALAILDSGGDVELRDLAEEELESAKQNLCEISDELKILLLPKDPNDDKNVVIEIRAGTGGDESALFCGSLFRMYSMYAEARRYKVEVVSQSETELGGYKEISFMIEGDGAYSRLKFESGTHRVQRVPETESQGRIHTSAVTVAVLPEAEEVEIDINPTDLKIDYFRSSGAGGQHVNTTDSAVRITHLPSGTVVECQDERSQNKNRDKAMRVLRSRIYENVLEQQRKQIASDRKSQVGSGDRSERIRTYNFPQGRVTDHRIGLTLYRIDAILNGDLDEVIDSLITADRAAKLSGNDEI